MSSLTMPSINTSARLPTKIVAHEPTKVISRSLSRMALIEAPTPLGSLETYSEHLEFEHPIAIKREDLTSKLYGGNKVRNLEFILSDVLEKKVNSIKTLVPYGSNFAAAIASECRRLSIPLKLYQFMADSNPQTHAHAQFAARHHAELKTHEGRSGPAKALFDYLNDQNSYAITPGGSNILGATGHLRALLEGLEQYRNVFTHNQDPTHIFIGAGTCGNSAGLLAGLTHLRSQTKLVAVRCASPLICNRRKIIRLANQTLSYLGSTERVKPGQLEITEAPAHIKYGVPSPAAILEARKFFDLEKISLDLTYTSKVIAALAHMKRHARIAETDRVLYWHTYSSIAHPMT